ncbi:MAG: AAA family ATPase [Pseudomonadales bacterium]|nr:AAA family ATPase [Pseudomonadales bacterium]
MPKVIVVSGPPASGKTTLAKYLSAQLNLPILAKDFLKESLLDSLGYSGRERSVEIGYAAFQLHLALAREFASMNINFIYETAFYKQSTDDIVEALTGCKIIQVHLQANIETMLLRAKTRDRHPGHADWYDGYESECREKHEQGVYAPLEIDGVLIEVDSNNFESDNYKMGIQDVIRAYGY